MSFLQSLVALLARVLLSQIFILAGLNHLSNWSGTIQYMTSKGMALQDILGGSGVAFVHVMLAEATAFLLIGGLSVLLGFRARGGAALLVLFLIPATLIFHDFWSCDADDPQRVPQMMHFMKNTGLAGGALMVLAFGSGVLSLDRFWRRRRTSSPAVENATSPRGSGG
jgi:putative oxidoreductase